MASDSIVGAVTDGLSAQSKELLSAVVAAISGIATVADVGESTVVFGADATGNLTGTLIAQGGQTVGSIQDGSVNLGVSLPDDVGLNFAGPKEMISAAAAAQYFNDLIDAALPASNTSEAVVEKRESLEAAVALASDGQGSGLGVRVLSITNESTTGSASDTIKLSGAAATKEVVAVNAANLSATQTLVLENLDRVVLVNDAKVQVIGSAAFVAGDNANQNISGGFGDDTLVGGGGSDTLVGGYGADRFGLTGGGTTIVGDFKKSQGDKLAFQFAGISTTEQLVGAVTDIRDTPNGLFVSFGVHGAVTLVGISIADITADMVQLQINKT
jgi:Ca2+-binding RTX toxin-like protein